MLAFESTTPLYNRSLSASSTRRLVLAHETAIKAHFFPLILDFKSQQDIKELVTTPRWRHTIGVARPQGCCVAMHHFAFWGGGYCYCCHCQRRCPVSVAQPSTLLTQKTRDRSKTTSHKGLQFDSCPSIKRKTHYFSMSLFLGPNPEGFWEKPQPKSITPAHRQ